MLQFSSFTQQLDELKRAGHLEVAKTSPDDAYEFFGGALARLGYSIDDDFPDFKKNYLLVRGKVAFGRLKRKEMPVVKSGDLDRFKKWMMITHGVRTTNVKIKPVNMLPLQKQIYLDHPIASIKKHSLRTSLKFIRQDSHSLVSHDSYIMDGNHRFLLAALHNPNTQTNAYRVAMTHDDLILAMNDFTDNVIKRPRNESVI